MTRLSLAALLALAIALIAAGCGSDDSDTTKSSDTKSNATTTTTATTETSSDEGSGGGDVEGKLVVNVSANGDGKTDNTLTFECPPDHFASQGVRDLCATLGDDPGILTEAAPDPSGGECPVSTASKVTATIVGTYQGKPFNQTYSRANSCEIDKWNQIEPIIAQTGYGVDAAREG